MAVAEKPNVLLICVDDLRPELNCYGVDYIHSPNIDRLAAQGQRWTSFYSSGATCVPSRRGLMTGRHPSLMGKTPLVQNREQLMPAMLKKAGYSTGMLGKRHLANVRQREALDAGRPAEWIGRG